MKHFFTKLVKQFWKYSPLWYWQVCPSDTLMLLMEKLIRSIQCQRSQRKTFLWKRRSLKTKNRPCQKTTPFIYWWSGFPRVFLPFAVLCRKSYCIDQDVHYQAILSRKSCTNLSFSPDAFWCQSEVVFWLYLKDFFWRKKNQQGLPYPCTCKFYNEDMNFCNVGQAIYFPKKSICAPVGNLINLDM